MREREHCPPLLRPLERANPSQIVQREERTAKLILF